MKRVLLVFTVLAVILTGAWAAKEAPDQATREQYIAAKANELIGQGINLFASIAYEKGYADGYGQARLECFQNDSKLPTKKASAK